MDPTTLRFAQTHEWVSVSGDVATVGLSQFAVDALTDLVYLELPEQGATLEAGEVFGVVESVKAASDLYAPVSGEVIEVNDDLPMDLGMLSDEPYEGGWILKVRLSDESEPDALMDHEAYQAHCESA